VPLTLTDNDEILVTDVSRVIYLDLENQRVPLTLTDNDEILVTDVSRVIYLDLEGHND